MQKQYHELQNRQVNSAQDRWDPYLQNNIQNSPVPNNGDNGQFSQEQFGTGSQQCALTWNQLTIQNQQIPKTNIINKYLFKINN